MDYEHLSAVLHAEYPEDAAQAALVALIQRPESPRNPLAYCRTVARRQALGCVQAVNAARPWLDRHGNTRLVHPDLDLDPGAFGTLDPPQLARLEAREELTSLDPLDLVRGMGYLDPPPQDPRPLKSGDNPERKRYREARARILRRVRRAK